MEKEVYDGIVVNPEVMVGKPVIKGTRIPVDMIVRLIAKGMTIQDILEDCPILTKGDIKAALEYVASLAEGEDVFPLMDK